MLEADRVNTLPRRGVIEVAPLAFMRGRTLNDSFIILDEAQNTTPEQMKMFLTRLGFNSKMVVTGDITQIDLPGDQRSGLVVVRRHPQRRHRHRLHQLHRRGRRAPQARAADRRRLRRSTRRPRRPELRSGARSPPGRSPERDWRSSARRAARRGAGRAARPRGIADGHLSVELVDAGRGSGS